MGFLRVFFDWKPCFACGVMGAASELTGRLVPLDLPPKVMFVGCEFACRRLTASTVSSAVLQLCILDCFVFQVCCTCVHIVSSVSTCVSLTCVMCPMCLANMYNVPNVLGCVVPYVVLCSYVCSCYWTYWFKCFSLGWADSCITIQSVMSYVHSYDTKVSKYVVYL